ncbi:14344_t:CDS:1 [Entrophospora sp. SA101]|nr:9928_t:CDS:1 [Entrophospora sp. SA101]CAJ0830672.1 14344_t:CDS:1 [Entrophospora sp. SA101]
MASIELNQYKDVMFPNLDVSQKAIVDILEAFRHLKESHIKISGRNNDVKKLDKSSSKFNDLVVRIAKGSLKKSMDLEDFTEYFKMLTEDNVTSNYLLQTLLVLKDMAKQRISDSEELKNDFEQFKTSIAENISQSPKSFGDSDVELVQRNHLLQITDGSQPPNFLNALAQFLPDVFMLVFTLVSTRVLNSFSTDSLPIIGQSLKDNIKPSISASNVRQLFTQSYLSSVNLSCLNLVIISGYSIYNRKSISRKLKYLIIVAKRYHLTGFYKRNNNTIMNDEREQKKIQKYEEKISTKLPVILTHLETLIQFWKQQYGIFESHINALQSMDGNVNLRLSKNLTAGIIERCTAEKINCKEFHQMLNDSVFKNSFIRLD